MKTRFLSRAFALGVGILVCSLGFAAQPPGTQPPHAQHSAAFSHPEFRTEAEYDKAMGIDHAHEHILSKNCVLQRQVYGWHPAWSGTAYQQYDFALVSTVAYYSYEIDPATGWPRTTHQWKDTRLVEMAHASGAQVELTASIAGAEAAALLRNPKACKQLCDSLLTLVQFKDADGVCLDVQGLPRSSRADYVALVQRLGNSLRDWRKASTVTITLPASDVAGAYDVAALAPLVDRMVVCAYGTRDTRNPGPVGPLRASAAWGETGFTNALRAYLDAGAPPNKLLAGVPYYGLRWPTASTDLGAAATGPAEIQPLRIYEAMDSSAFLNWDTSSATGWLKSPPGQAPWQLWTEQVTSVSEKFNQVNTLGIAGVAVWALGYDHGSERYWNLLKGSFADCPDVDALAANEDTRHPALRGKTSAERNTWNWVWMIGGGVVAIVIMIVVKRVMK